ncbi:MAG: acyl-CoA dehydrogenase [Calditrichaeota bacterium]|nr:acyl-CoA dehydrogenase [Calditrichota bacterium]
MIRESVRDFANQVIKPLALEMDQKNGLDQSLLPQFFELGIMGIEIPEEYEGMGGSFFQSVLVIEELAKVDPAISVIVDVQNTLVNNAFLKWGNKQLKDKYLSQLATSKLGAFGLSEAGSGSDAFALATVAEDKGDHYVLNGRKLWITNGKEAELFLVFANEDKSKGYKGITAFIVEKDFEGFTVGKKEDKLGIRASSTCELLFDNCIVPKENVLGENGKGYKVAIETLNEGRIGIGAQMIGLAQGALDQAIQYIQEREQFGKTLASNQGVQFDISRMAIELECARLLVYEAARLKENGMDFLKVAAMAKYKASEVAEYVASLSLEMFGGNGFTKEYPMEKYYRDAKIGKIYEGTSNMQLQTIAKILIK